MNNPVLSKAQALNTKTADFLAELASIASLSGREEKIVARLKKEMEAIGFDEIIIDGLGNIIGRIGNGSIKVAFDAHIDTVDVGNRNLWKFNPHDGHVKDGKVWGRGVADQKGGMASMLTAARIIKELDLAKNCTVYFTGTVMEEDCDGLCWNYIVNEDKIKPDFVVITEPTGCRIYRGQRGRMEISISVAGLSAHGSAPERGDNAVYKIAPLIKEFELLNERLAFDEFLGKGTVVLSQIKSVSPSLCAVPDFCSIYLDRRLTWGETKESALAEIRTIIEKSKIDAKVELPIYREKAFTGKIYPMEKYYPTWKLEENHPLVQAGIASYKELFKKAPVVDKWTFSTNGVTIRGVHGIPCIGFGPGFEEQAHAPNEWTPVEHLWQAAAFYTGLVKKIATDFHR
ncbi:MAG: YgeY family selenium metabolism-linked hydrolase [Candidatus Marinimicrobia bacterium]|nr:YgeY family selenium metabolism-linked hydrolase [Candidatus Neomarinimicrobiota bacterium]MCK9559989.1 YgeY family selenium metabolism-linked hydrolase [Candidatus Neomarinimicrobiota bacterium]